jgi:hypothetical protein
MAYGSMPIDDGHLISSEEEAGILIKNEPYTQEIIRPYYGGEEFINNKKRFCLWLVDISPSLINKSKMVKDRIEQTRIFRKTSKREATNKLAATLLYLVKSGNRKQIICLSRKYHRKIAPISQLVL